VTFRVATKLPLKEVSGVAEEVDIEKNFELISKLHPNLKNLLIINDKSITGLAVKKDLNPIIEKYSKKFNIEYTDNLEISDLKDKVSELEKGDSAILFVLLFKDTTGKYFTYKQSFEEVRKVSQVPIYGLWDFYLNSGMVGGLLTSAIAQGDTVSKMALDVLNGKDIKDIPVVEKSPNLYIFNYDELKRFNLNVSKYIDNPIIINEPSSIYKEHKNFFIITILTISLLTIIVVVLKANIQRREKLERELSNRIEFDKVLLDTIPKSGKNSDRAKSYLDYFTTSVMRKNTNIFLLFVMAIVLKFVTKIAYQVLSFLRIRVVQRVLRCRKMLEHFSKAVLIR
jgi:hypothetical protein